MKALPTYTKTFDRFVPTDEDLLIVPPAITAHLPGQHDQQDHTPHGAGLPRSEFRDPITGKPLTRTDIGDTFERMLIAKAEHILQGRYGGQLELLTAERRQNPLDVRIADRGFEVKTINAGAKNQRVAMKPEEVASKIAYAADNGLKPGVLVQVAYPDQGRIKLFVYEDGISSKMVSRMEPIGSYRFTEDEFVETLAQVRQ